MILPYLSYCSEIWGNTYESSLAKLKVLQKRAIRIIGGLQKHQHTSETFASLKCLKFNDLIIQKSCNHVFTAAKGKLPKLLQQRFSKVNQVHNHNTRFNKKNLYKFSYKKFVKKMCLSVEGVNRYNTLPPDLTETNDVNIFRKRLKKWFICKY